MSVVPFKVEHIAGLGPWARWINADVAAELVKSPYAITVLIDDVPAVSAGAYELWEGRFLSWSCVNHDAARGHWKTVHGAVKALTEQVVSVARRLEAQVQYDFEPGRRWVEGLGFKLETERLRNYLPDGKDAAGYVIVKE